MIVAADLDTPGISAKHWKIPINIESLTPIWRWVEESVCSVPFFHSMNTIMRPPTNQDIPSIKSSSELLLMVSNFDFKTKPKKRIGTIPKKIFR